MNMSSQSTELKRFMSIAAGGVASLCGTGPARITCLAGRLWVTHEGIPGDHILRPGQTLTIGRGGVALVSGTPTASLEYSGLQPAKHCSKAERVGSRLSAWLVGLAGRPRGTTSV